MRKLPSRNTEITDITYKGGFGHLQKGHGIGFADLDRDGDQDIYAVMGGAFEGYNFTNILYENPAFGNNWQALEFAGNSSTKDAIGTQIEITLTSREKSVEMSPVEDHSELLL